MGYVAIISSRSPIASLLSVLYRYALEALIEKGVGPDHIDQIVEHITFMSMINIWEFESKIRLYFLAFLSS